jgi:hypothetical protein
LKYKIIRGRFVNLDTGKVESGTLVPESSEVFITSEEARKAARRKFQQNLMRAINDRGKYVQALHEPNIALEKRLSLSFST